MITAINLFNNHITHSTSLDHFILYPLFHCNVYSIFTFNSTMVLVLTLRTYLLLALFTYPFFYTYVRYFYESTFLSRAPKEQGIAVHLIIIEEFLIFLEILSRHYCLDVILVEFHVAVRTIDFADLCCLYFVDYIVLKAFFAYIMVLSIYLLNMLIINIVIVDHTFSIRSSFISFICTTIINHEACSLLRDLFLPFSKCLI